MVTAKPKGKYSYADYAATPGGERWELIDGVLIGWPLLPIPDTMMYPTIWEI